MAADSSTDAVDNVRDDCIYDTRIFRFNASANALLNLWALNNHEDSITSTYDEA
jgi:hypothetical protein